MSDRVTACFCTSGDLDSTVIKWLTESRFSHVAMGVTLHGEPMVIHSTIGGVQIANRRRYFQREHLIEERDLGEPWRVTPTDKDCVQFALSEVGLGYDYAHALWRAKAILLWRGFKIRCHRPMATVREQVCSEFMVRLRHPALTRLQPEVASAQTYWQACEDAGCARVFPR